MAWIKLVIMMPVYKDKNGTWYVSCWYTDNGVKKKKTKRGFEKKQLALEWERQFLLKSHNDPQMTFESFAILYEKDVRPKLKEHTWITKENILRKHLLPHFGKMRLSEISPITIVDWQNRYRSASGYSQSYLKTINSTFSAIFNHAVRFYSLEKSPLAISGGMGSSKPKQEMFFWTEKEYSRFADEAMEDPIYYMVFQILYFTGIREGELLALTRSDFDLENKTLRINKSYQRIKGKDVITPPKTPRSNRIISLPDFLCEEISDFFQTIYGIHEGDRIFSSISKFSIGRHIKSYADLAGVKRIRPHDLRHSHVSLLIELGFSPLAIADRIGHDDVSITLRTYSHLFPNKRHEIAEKLDTLKREMDKEEKDDVAKKVRQ